MGSTTNRVHYHCLIFSDIEINSISWKYGFYNLKPIFDNRFSSVSHYILKYSCHELKCKSKTYYSFKGYDVIKENTIRNFFKQLDNDKIYNN